METTFITIHDLSKEALILYSSDSIIDILGYTPDEVVNRSTWDFFLPTDVSNAQKLHERSVKMDKASVLVYCDIRNRRGDWVRCECCFSIVYDVMVACTSIYSEGAPGQIRRSDAPIVRRLFSSSPQDPRYHMLQHLSARFRQSAQTQSKEPRAALFLNRFTRTMTIMYATSGVEQILGISADEMTGRSFYYCIAQSCLADAVQCLETAKGNDSIAYLRFLFRDPRQLDEPEEEEAPELETDAEMTDVGASESEADNGSVPSSFSASGPRNGANDIRSSNGTTPSVSTNSANNPIELEAVVSCTSDGLVVCLRRARPAVPSAIQNTTMPQTTPQPYTGYYAAPWGLQAQYLPQAPTGYGPTAYPGMPPAYGGPPSQPIIAGQLEYADGNGQKEMDFLRAIQECGVFAWDLVGINGTLADHARGSPSGRSAPPDGPAVWQPSDLAADSSSGRGTASNSGPESTTPQENVRF